MFNLLYRHCADNTEVYSAIMSRETCLDVFRNLIGLFQSRLDGCKYAHVEPGTDRAHYLQIKPVGGLCCAGEIQLRIGAKTVCVVQSVKKFFRTYLTMERQAIAI